MTARLRCTIVGVLAAAVVVGVLVFGMRPQAQEPADTADPEVTESELELFIEVYNAMQDDHARTIDTVLAARSVTVKRFRNIEQRVQRRGHLVKRVRQALLEHAKARSGAPPPPTRGEQE